MNPFIRLQPASVTFGMKFGVQPQAVSMAMKRWIFQMFQRVTSPLGDWNDGNLPAFFDV